MNRTHSTTLQYSDALCTVLITITLQYSDAVWLGNIKAIQPVKSAVSTILKRSLLNNLAQPIVTTEQEARLLFRNRASATHFLVARLVLITAFTKTYVHYVQNLHPMNRLMYYTANKNGAQL